MWGNNWRVTAVGLLDVYRGHQTWADFIGGQALFTALEELSPRRTRDASTDDKSETLTVGLTARVHRVPVESGLGAWNPDRLRRGSGNALRLALGIESWRGAWRASRPISIYYWATSSGVWRCNRSRSRASSKKSAWPSSSARPGLIARAPNGLI